MRQLPLALALLALGIGPGAADAQAADKADTEPAFHAFHYIVFQHQGYWDSSLATSGPSGAKKTLGATEKIDADSFDGLWQALSKSGNYRPLRQGLVVRKPRPEAEAEPLTIDGRWPASISGPFLPLPGILPPLPPFAAGTEIPTTDRLFGRLRFYKGRYAHLDVHLTFAEPVRWIPSQGMARQYHILDQSRRMLPGRTYYFDRPRFGIIARVTPLD